MIQKKRLRGMSDGSLTAMGMALALGFLVAMISVPVSAVVVNFPDPALETAIRDAIGKPTRDIHDTDLIGLTSLNANNRGIVNLEGIQYCVDLTTLYLAKNKIVDTSALSGLTNLTTLYLYDNEISDLSELSGLANLTELALMENQIVDISALVHNTGLGSGDSVDIRYNYLDLTPNSSDMLDIEALQGRGVDVDYEPQY